jgi:arabinose-5-phosphate isomerase
MITRTDVVVAISNSGETPELVLLLPHLKRLAVPLIVLVGKADSTLGRASAVAIDVSVPEEACPLNLAPTASTTATLAMGDALAVSILEARGFTEQDFAMSHPSGSLGRQLLLHVEDVMRTGAALPRVVADDLLGAGLVEMSKKGLGMTVVVDSTDVEPQDHWSTRSGGGGHTSDGNASHHGSTGCGCTGTADRRTECARPLPRRRCLS